MLHFLFHIHGLEPPLSQHRPWRQAALDSGSVTLESEFTSLFSASPLAGGMGPGFLPVQRLGWCRHSEHECRRKHPKL